MNSLNGQMTMNKLLAILIFPFCIHANEIIFDQIKDCLLYTSPSPRDVEESRMPSSA